MIDARDLVVVVVVHIYNSNRLPTNKSCIYIKEENVDKRGISRNNE